MDEADAPEKPKNPAPWDLWPRGAPRETYDPGLKKWRPVLPYESQELEKKKVLFDPAAGAWISAEPAGETSTPPVVVSEPVVAINAELPRDLL